LGNDLPERDIDRLAQHGLLVANDKTALHFRDTRCWFGGKHLTGLPV